MSTNQSTAAVVIEHATSRRPEGIISLAESVGHMPPDADKVAGMDIYQWNQIPNVENLAGVAIGPDALLAANWRPQNLPPA